MTTFQNLNLNPKILSALKAKGYTIPTPIQLQSIPHILEKRDILGIAQTGTGKTAAFSLPIIHNLVESGKNVKSGGMRTLILTPTRELASQVAANIELYAKGLNLKHAVIFGGVSEQPQINIIRRGVDILIATPGRLLDLANQGYIRFMDLEIFVLDEADRMLDMGFIHDIKKIISKIPHNRQTLLFSATMPNTIADLAHSILKNPAKVAVTPPATTVERITQEINFVAKADKPSLLKHVLKNSGAQSVLVFARTKHGADRIVTFLQKNSISVAAIHGNKSQGAREKALSGFRSGNVKILIATDIAARGIDVPSISHVINYDIPVDPESYIHRIGRTARAGKAGIAISFCDSSEIDALRAIEKTIKSKIPIDDLHPFHDQTTKISYHRSGHSSQHPIISRNSRNDGEIKSQNNFNRRSRTQRNSKSEDTKSSGFLGFIGFGKKRPKSSNQEKSGGFGFGSWFKDKKGYSRNSEKRSDLDNRGNSSGNSRRSRFSESASRTSDRNRRSKPSGNNRSYGNKLSPGSHKKF